MVAAVTSPMPGMGSSRRTRVVAGEDCARLRVGPATSTVMASMSRRPAASRPRAPAGSCSSASGARPGRTGWSSGMTRRLRRPPPWPRQPGGGRGTGLQPDPNRRQMPVDQQATARLDLPQGLRQEQAPVRNRLGHGGAAIPAGRLGGLEDGLIPDQLGGEFERCRVSPAGQQQLARCPLRTVAARWASWASSHQMVSSWTPWPWPVVASWGSFLMAADQSVQGTGCCSASTLRLVLVRCCHLWSQEPDEIGLVLSLFCGRRSYNLC
jgi:hypothetical protein